MKSHTCVVVVDDERDAAESFALLLETKGLRAAVALSGRDAVEMVKRIGPTIVVCDIDMPGMNGLETARALRSLPAGHGLHLIALSGRDDVIAEARDAGFENYFVKPAGVSAASDLIEALCGKSGQ